MSLPPFSGLGSLCPKCGSKGLSARHLADNRAVQYGSVAWKAEPDVFPCMQRRCPVCQYETLEAPLSASDALTAPSPSLALPIEVRGVRLDDTGMPEGM